MKLQIEYLKKEELKPYANNAKIHTDDQIKQIKRSIEEFGFIMKLWKLPENTSEALAVSRNLRNGG